MTPSKTFGTLPHSCSTGVTPLGLAEICSEKRRSPCLLLRPLMMSFAAWAFVVGSFINCAVCEF
jgi:hypothetical protein